jgi:hypothetical protein
MDKTLEFFQKARIIVAALTSSELINTKDNDFRKILHNAIDSNYIKEVGVITPEVISHVRSILIPIIKANPHVKKNILTERRNRKLIIETNIKHIVKELTGPLSKGTPVEYESGFTASIDDWSGLIMLSSQESYDSYCFHTIRACAEFIVMNDDLFENKDNWKEKLKESLLNNEDFVNNITPRIEEIVKDITKWSVLSIPDSKVVAAVLIDITMGTDSKDKKYDEEIGARDNEKPHA